MKRLFYRATWIMVAIAITAGWACTSRGVAADPADPFADFTRAWRDDPAWHDGKAECCVYDATREIYGQLRQYRARLYTDQELTDPDTKTKSATGHGRAAFKHHLREDIATENYDYHYSTMCYVGVSDLKSLKLDMGSQEDCGATFKQYINHAGRFSYHQFSYFPKEGHRTGQSSPPENLAFQDALSVLLRGYPFEQAPQLTLMLLPDQTSNKLSAVEPVPYQIRYVGWETLDLPIGAVEAHHLEVSPVSGGNDPAMHYWFAADGTAPMLHVMVQYEGPGGISYRLRSLERRAYWKR